MHSLLQISMFITCKVTNHPLKIISRYSFWNMLHVCVCVRACVFADG
jgi:hypothetical protein